MARRFFQPVNVVAVPDPLGTVRLVGVNDTAAPVQVDLEAFAVTLDGAGTRPLASAGAPVGTDAAETLTEFRADALEAGEILAFRWQASNGMAGGDVFAPVALEAPRPPRPADRRRDPRRRTARSSPASPPQAVALFATLEADRPGRFSTNADRPLPRPPGRDHLHPRRRRPRRRHLHRPRPLFQLPPDRQEGDMTDFSYQLYCSRNFPPLSETLKMVAAAGYKNVEGYGALYADEAKVAELNAAPRRQRPQDAHRPLRHRPAREGARPRAGDRQGRRHRDDLLPLPPARPAPRHRQGLARLRPAAADGRRPLPRRRPRLRLAQPRLRVQDAPPTARCRRPRSSRAAPTSNGRPTSPG